ncbi:MAG: response regulator [Chitinivibrionales bacterium]|nr:response regulator [Chitinivibrionales bacterium]
MLNEKQIDILIVEDSDDDITLLKELFVKCNSHVRLHVVHDGDEAMRFMYKLDIYSAAVQPNLIILDLNLPKVSGQEVLVKVKSDPRFCHIPVIILTTSTSENDINRAYRSNANCYINKPIDLDAFTNVVEMIDRFWLNTVALPGLLS